MGQSDVQRALEKVAHLEEIDPYVREKYQELWEAAQTEEPE